MTEVGVDERREGELLGVCRPGGTIGLAGPTYNVLSGDMFAVIGKYAPPPPGLNPPLRWGTDAGLDELLGAATRSIQSELRSAMACWRSIDHAWEVFSTHFGPIIRALKTLDEDEQMGLRNDFNTVFERYNRATDGTAVIENTYFLTVAVRA